jgi:hypothetical protein
MAHVACRMMTNSGDELAESKCAGCGAPFRSGQIMNAMEYENGDTAGWQCEACVEYWKANGRPRNLDDA